MPEFDTLDVKPKLWALIPLWLGLAAVLAALFFLAPDGPGRTRAALLVLLAGEVASLVLIARAFFRQLRYNPYSYNTIFYSGFFLYGLFFAVITGLYAFLAWTQPEFYGTVYSAVSTLAGAARTYTMFTFPFLVLFGLGLVISTFALVRREGLHLGNLLGVALVFLVIGWVLTDYFNNYYVSGSEWEVMLHDLLWNAFCAVFLYFECMLLGAMVANAVAVRYRPRRDKDFIIILGCGIREDGTPTPLLQARVDRALAFARQQEAETGKAPVFIPSGGQGPDEVISEARCMADYLLARGVPEERILPEERSTSTRENMAFSKEIIDGLNPKAKVLFATTNYHVFRSGLHARRVKLRAQGVGARTRWYFWPNAAVREFVGLLTAHRLKQGLILLGLVLLNLALTLAAFLCA